MVATFGVARGPVWLVGCTGVRWVLVGRASSRDGHAPFRRVSSRCWRSCSSRSPSRDVRATPWPF